MGSGVRIWGIHPVAGQLRGCAEWGPDGALQAYVSTLSPEASERLRLEYDGSEPSSCMAEANNAVSELPMVVAMSTFADAIQEIRERSDNQERLGAS